MFGKPLAYWYWAFITLMGLIGFIILPTPGLTWATYVKLLVICSVLLLGGTIMIESYRIKELIKSGKRLSFK